MKNPHDDVIDKPSTEKKENSMKESPNKPIEVPNTKPDDYEAPMKANNKSPAANAGKTELDEGAPDYTFPGSTTASPTGNNT